MNYTASKIPLEWQSKVFRPVYYLGCKASFTSTIKTAINDIDPSGGRLLDLFAGTGSVGAALGAEREVTTVDVQEYSRVLCSAVLCPSIFSNTEIKQLSERALHNETTKQLLWCLEPLIKHERWCLDQAASGDVQALATLIESPPLAVRETHNVNLSSSLLNDAAQNAILRLHGANLWKSPDTTVTRYFGGLYFSYTQAALLDAVLSVAVCSEHQHRDTLMAAVLSTASQLVNTVGKQFAQPIQPRNKTGTIKSSLAKIVARDRSMPVLEIYQAWLGKYSMLPRAVGQPKALRQDYLEALSANSSSYSVVYADPPYTRDHYSRFYHVLETMCLRDEPVVSRIVKNGKKIPSRGAYRESRHQSEFCIKSTAPNAFNSLFRTVREQDLPLVLSYSPHENGDGTHPRVVSMEHIIELAHKHYDRVKVCFIDGVTHNKLNSSALKLKSRDHSEVLLKCFR
ncbi:MAG: DNA adenine methylase [Idiomarina sp.]